MTVINRRMRTTTLVATAVLVCHAVVHVLARLTYTDQFVIHVEGGPDVARALANKHNFQYLAEIFPAYYHLRHNRVAKRSAEPSHEHHATLSQEPQVKWFSQQTLKRRTKRDYRYAREPSDTVLNDPKWPQMWYLNRGQGLDMNVQGAWAKGVTGKGVVVTILDDGLEKDHPDIARNYDPAASYDVNNHDADPQPRYDVINSNRHGTRCAGEVAANANNSICAVGIAYEARVGGVRMLDGDVTDAVEARSLSLNPQYIDIYSASWGPDDDGRTVDGPGELATKAFIEGIQKGRDGLGSIFVWASGNGGREHDNCNCDGYTNSIWTLSISSATENGLVPWYSEACSSTLATTYSSGSYGERQIVTTDLRHGCTSSHTGTSASAPLAAGICALALQANTNLTWRDMQHIVVRTARPANLHARDWKINGVGRNVSHSFGYGLMDATAMVDLAKQWKSVPPQKVCEVRAHRIDKFIPAKAHVEISLDVKCENVRYLEHVIAKISLTANRRGDIHMYLTSPSGTRSTLLAQRPADNSRSGFQTWPFMTVHSWGENPNGQWKLEIHNEGRFYGRASLKEWSLILYGTSEDPDRSARTSTSTTSTTTSTTTTTTTPSTTTTRMPITVPPPPFRPPVQHPPLPHHMHMPPYGTKLPPYSGSFSENDILHDNHVDVPQQDSHSNSQNRASLTDLSVVMHGTRDSTRLHEPGHHHEMNRAGCAFQDQTSGQCLECGPGLYLLSSECVEGCPPEGYFGATETVASTGSKISVCRRCHYTCKSCKGANDYDCVECYGDATRHGNLCHPRSLVQQVEFFGRWYATMTSIFVCLCLVFAALVIYIVMEKSHSPLSCGRCCARKRTYSELPMRRTKTSHISFSEDTMTFKPYKDEDNVSTLDENSSAAVNRTLTDSDDE